MISAPTPTMDTFYPPLCQRMAGIYGWPVWYQSRAGAERGARIHGRHRGDERRIAHAQCIGSLPSSSRDDLWTQRTGRRTCETPIPRMLYAMYDTGLAIMRLCIRKSSRRQPRDKGLVIGNLQRFAFSLRGPSGRGRRCRFQLYGSVPVQGHGRRKYTGQAFAQFGGLTFLTQS